MKSVKVYTTTYCGFCKSAKALLQSEGIPYEEVDVTTDDVMRDKLVEMTGGLRTVPQIFIGDKGIGGFTDLKGLQTRGELKTLVADS